MNKKFYLYLNTFFLVFISGCNILNGEPDVQGYVMDKSNGSILVVGTDEYLNASGEKQEHLSPTFVSDVSIEVELGELVFIWSKDGVLESFPAQASARRTKILDNIAPEGAQLSEAEALKAALLQHSSPKDYVGVQSVKFDKDKNEWFITLKSTMDDTTYDYKVDDQ